MVRAKYFGPPCITPRLWQVWRRNFLVWRKLAVTSLLGSLADPMLYMLGLGFGLGSLLPRVDGTPYITFLAAGTVCYSTMNSATFEALYSAFSRMHVQKTWDAILNTPMNLDDIVIAEVLWAASKSLLSGTAILVIILALGLSHSPLLVWVIPLTILIGLTFGGLGLCMTALSPSFDFFLYYFTLVVTPMVLLCGVFFPVSQLPPLLQHVAAVLPLSHAIDLVRPLVNGAVPERVLMHVLVLSAYAAVGAYLALVLARRRLLT
ncbi:MAG TPA: ABC transporter permease [Burkholderiales bacterium]|nr:ABC transporter permease [Burkholderiales bacterium]